MTINAPAPKFLPNGTAVRCRYLHGDRILHIGGVLVSPGARTVLYWFSDALDVVNPDTLEVVEDAMEVTA